MNSSLYFTPAKNIINITAKSFQLPLSISNIRLLKWNYNIIGDEPLEVIEYKKAQEELWKWNHEFWLSNNTRFEREKAQYENEMMKFHHVPTHDDCIRRDTILPEDMAIFYKNYLDNYQEEFKNYHWLWWRKNVHLLKLSLKATKAHWVQKCLNWKRCIIY